MRFETIQPSKELSRFVKHYWILESIPTSSYVHRIIPNGLTELIFYLSSKPKIIKNDKKLSDNILVNGQRDSYFDIEISEKLSLFSVYFLPHGLSMFLDLPMNEVFNQSIPLRFLFRNDVAQLEDEMLKAKTTIEKVTIMERFLMKKLCLKKEYEYKRMTHGIDIINRSKGIIKIKELASELCLSRRQFERTFLSSIGLSPKQFLKIVRFQNAIQNKKEHSNTSLTRLAVNCGYYDQSHMIEDFQYFSGLSPKKYFRDCEPYSDYFQ